MKKFFKKLGLFVILFLVVMYFIGSCTELPEYKPKEENNRPVYTELTPDEYQKRMDEIVRQPTVTQTSFNNAFEKSHILTTYAADNPLVEKIKDYYYSTPFFESWLIGVDDISNTTKSIADYFKKDSGWYDDIENYPISPAEPKTSVTIPYQYQFKGKNRVVYNNGSYEIISCEMVTTGAKNSGKTGSVRYTRTNPYGEYTHFGFDINMYALDSNFGSSSAFVVRFYLLSSGQYGNLSSIPFGKPLYAYFVGSSENSLKQFNISSSNAVSNSFICSSSSGTAYPNVFSICSTSTNDYSFKQSVDNYYTTYNYWRLPNVYYNNNAGYTITQNNVTNYNQYGYTYNSITGGIEFDPDVYASFFDLNIKPKLELAYNDIFSDFPDINATFGDLDIQYNNLIEIMTEIKNQSTSTGTTISGTYPVATGDINVNVTVDVTFPEEFYRKYPTLTTEPAFVAESPDVDFALDAPLPVRALEVAGVILTSASDFIDDAGLMPIALMSVSLCLVAVFFF